MPVQGGVGLPVDVPMKHSFENGICKICGCSAVAVNQPQEPPAALDGSCGWLERRGGARRSAAEKLGGQVASLHGSRFVVA